MKATTTLRKISALKKRIKVIQGGQGAGKTFAILFLLINHASSNPDKEIFIVSAELTKMRLTVIKDFIKIMKSVGMYDSNRMLGGTLYRFENSSFIKFLGMDKEDIGKGLRSDIVFVNEANKINFETYRELTSRAKKVILDFNPNSKFWVHDEIIPRDDADFIKLTYKDNEYLSQEEVFEIENYKAKGYDADGNIINEYWANKWRVYGLGLEGKIEGVVFQNWEVGEFDYSLPVMYGCDWGFKDPFVLIKVAFDEKNKKCYVDEKVYKSWLTPDDIYKLIDFHIVEKSSLVLADSSQPSMINGCNEKGFNFIGLAKEKVITGIYKLQDYQIIVTPQSINIQEELHNYIWLDKSGEVPVDKFNHSIDALRYVEKYHRLANN